jgi:hypothetical protein
MLPAGEAASLLAAAAAAAEMPGSWLSSAPSDEGKSSSVALPLLLLLA